MAGREGDFLTDSDEHQEMYGGATPFGWLNRISDEMCLALTPFATELLLEGTQAEVARSRDSMGAGAIDRWDFKRLDVLREDVTTFVRDVEPVARELATNRWRIRATSRTGAGYILTILADHEAKRGGPSEEPQRSILSRFRLCLGAKSNEPTQLATPGFARGPSNGTTIATPTLLAPLRRWTPFWVNIHLEFPGNRLPLQMVPASRLRSNRRDFVATGPMTSEIGAFGCSR